MNGYAIGPFRLDVERVLLLHEREPVALGPKVVQTLLALAEHAGELVMKSELLDRVWPEGCVEEANLVQNVHVLRKVFALYGSANPIETVPRRGYRLMVPVCRLGAAPSAPPPSRVRLGVRAAAAAFVCSALAAAALMVFAVDRHGGGNGRAVLARDRASQYDLGRYYWDLRTRDVVRRSLTYFARVVNENPKDARGWAALADANVTIGDYCYGTHRPSVYFARAREYARKAVTFDPNSAEAHASLGFLALHRRDATLAEVELRRAIALDPTYAPGHEWYGIALIERGRTADGLDQLRKATDLDPLSVATLAWLGSGAYLQRRFDDAIAYSKQALELSPTRLDALQTMGQAQALHGDLRGAAEAFRRYGAVDPYYRPQAAALLARTYALAHRLPEARAELAYARSHADRVDTRELAAAAAAVEGRRNASLVRGLRARGHDWSMATEDAARIETSS
jgi:DNA-binding winged helix-turn-helix (wHTH) protein/tetratricopeptide (TPR) repeat protein